MTWSSAQCPIPTYPTLCLSVFPTRLFTPSSTNIISGSLACAFLFKHLLENWSLLYFGSTLRLDKKLDGNIKASSRSKEDHKHRGAFRFSKYRQNVLIMHADRRVKFENLNMDTNLQYFKIAVPYTATTDVRLRSKNVHGFFIHRNAIDTELVRSFVKGLNALSAFFVAFQSSQEKNSRSSQ